jgi:hypothetical protein
LKREILTVWKGKILTVWKKKIWIDRLEVSARIYCLPQEQNFSYLFAMVEVIHQKQDPDLSKTKE